MAAQTAQGNAGNGARDMGIPPAPLGVANGGEMIK